MFLMNKNNLHKIYLSIIIGLILLTGFIYLVFIRNRISVYSIKYVDDNIRVQNGMLFVSNELSILNFNKVVEEDNKKIRTIKLYFINDKNQEHLVISGANEDMHIKERGYGDEYSLYKLPKSKFYLTVTYEDETTKTIELKLVKEFTDNK